MSVSIRNGKLVPSMRFKPEAADVQNLTNWRIGIHPNQTYETTYGKQSEACKAAVYIPMPQIDKNSSHGESIQGGSKLSVSDQYTSDYRKGYSTGGVCNKEYQKTHPPPGRDRLTANRTNYQLGCQKDNPITAAQELFKNPECLAQPEQGTLGGAVRLSDKSYQQDSLSMDSIKRGGGGGQGCLGVPFNIITGKESSTRDDNLKRAGPRKYVKERLQETDSWGDVQGPTYVNVLSGKAVQKKERPPLETAATLKRPAQVILSTRPW